jgi:hypothetical protein
MVPGVVHVLEAIVGALVSAFRSVDFLTVPTATFRTLYVFVVLSLERRLLLHVNVTAHPYALWAAQQMVEAMGPEVRRTASAAHGP